MVVQRLDSLPYVLVWLDYEHTFDDIIDQALYASLVFAVHRASVGVAIWFMLVGGGGDR